MTVDEFPIEIRHLMLYRQEERHGKRDWSVFQIRKDGGFNWAGAPEEHGFWHTVITKEKFDVFYAKYPKVDYPKDMPEEIKMLALDRRVEQNWPKDNLDSFGFTWLSTPEKSDFWATIYSGVYTPYYTKYGNPNNACVEVPIPTPNSYKEQIADFPPEIVELMLQRQFEQTGKRDVSLFEKNKTLGKGAGGFNWGDTIEGRDFWDDVIEDKKFDVFYKKYPKEFNSHIKTKQNDKESTTNSTGIKVFKPVATIANGEKRTGTRISGRSSKTTIGSGHLSYQAVIGY